MLDVHCPLLCSDLQPRDRATPRCTPSSTSTSTSTTRAPTGRIEVNDGQEIVIQNQYSIYSIYNNTPADQHEPLRHHEPDRPDDITSDEATEHNDMIEELEEEISVIE